MRSAKDNAISLYLEGIENGNVREAVATYTGDRYIQHSTGVADGQEGFIAFFEPFLERNPARNFKVVRALQDGPHAFLQVYQNVNNGEAEWITTDFLDSDEYGKIVEHWDVIAAVRPPNPSGRTQLDGTTKVVDLEETAANKAIVIDFIQTCLIGRDVARMGAFIDADNYLQHSPNLGDGLDAFRALYAAEHCPLSYQECFLAVAEGNFVATLNRARCGGQDLCQVNLFRLQRGKIVEHWDNSEPVPPRREWVNSGKF